MLKHKTLLATSLVLTCTMPMQVVAKAAQSSAKALFEQYQTLSESFDPAVLDLYASDAVLKDTTVMADGSSKTTTMTMAQYKTVFPEVIKAMQASNEHDEFKHIKITVLDENTARITANRYSSTKCYEDKNYYMVLQQSNNQSWKITEEFQTSPHQSLCENGVDKELALSLQASAEIINKQLPAMIDADTQLTRMSAEGTTLTYHYHIVTLKADEIEEGFFEQTLKPMVIQQSCTMSTSKPLLDKGATLGYEYLSSDGQIMSTFQVTQSDC